jgi:hypothetical protein
MRRRRNVSHEENEDSKVHKGFSLRAVSWGLGYYFKNTSPSCARFKRRRRTVSHEENEDSKVYKGFLYEEKKNVSHKENEGSKVHKGPYYNRHSFDIPFIPLRYPVDCKDRRGIGIDA